MARRGSRADIIGDIFSPFFFFSSAPISRAESLLTAGAGLLVRIMKFSSHWQRLCSRVASLCRLFSSRLLLGASGSALFLLQQGRITLRQLKKCPLMLVCLFI